MNVESVRRYIIAEYCAGPFYMGWWLYERERNDGSANDRNEWGWLKGTERWDPQYEVFKLCGTMGLEPPEPRRYVQNFAEWFAGRFPGGLIVERNPEGGYSLLKIVSKIPHQPRGVIRTIGEAKRSFAIFCKERAR